MDSQSKDSSTDLGTAEPSFTKNLKLNRKRMRKRMRRNNQNTIGTLKRRNALWNWTCCRCYCNYLKDDWISFWCRVCEYLDDDDPFSGSGCWYYCYSLIRW